MSNIVGRMFDSRTKEEKQRDYEEYAQRIFPYGDDQKQEIGRVLKELLPKYRKEYLLMHYILIKEEVANSGSSDLDPSIKKIEKRRLIKITPEVTALVKALLVTDLRIDERLQYPSVPELQELAKKYRN